MIIENELSVKLNPLQMDECTRRGGKNSKVCNTEVAEENVMNGGWEHRMHSASISRYSV